MSYIYPQGQQTVIIPGGATTGYAQQPYGQQAYVAQPYGAAGGVPMVASAGYAGGYAQQPMLATAATGVMGQPGVAVVQPGVGTQFAVGGSTPLGLAGAGVQGGIGAGLGGLQGGVTTGGHLGPFTAQTTLGVQPGLGHHRIMPGGTYYAGGGYPYGDLAKKPRTAERREKLWKMSKSVASHTTATRKRKLPRLNENDTDEAEGLPTDSDDMIMLESPSETALACRLHKCLYIKTAKQRSPGRDGPAIPQTGVRARVHRDRKQVQSKAEIATSSRGRIIRLSQSDEELGQNEEQEPLQPNTLPLAAWFYGRKEHNPIIDEERFDGWLVWSDYAMTVQRTPDLVGTSRAPVLVWKLSDIDFVKATVLANGANLILAIALRKDKAASLTTRWFDPAENDVLLFKLNDSIPGCLNAFTALVNALISGTRGKLSIIS
ncbi:hypothetical protein FRB90_000334, partial [Tulasnella sp. 427]